MKIGIMIGMRGLLALLRELPARLRADRRNWRARATAFGIMKIGRVMKIGIMIGMTMTTIGWGGMTILTTMDPGLSMPLMPCVVVVRCLCKMRCSAECVAGNGLYHHHH